MPNNYSIAERFYSEIINKGDVLLMNELMSENFMDHYASPNLPKGLEGFKQFLQMLAGAFPDIQVHVEDMFSQGDKIAVRLSVTGTHSGTLLGKILPTGKQARWSGIDILKIEEGKITERWSQRDLLDLMRQIGVVS